MCIFCVFIFIFNYSAALGVNPLFIYCDGGFIVMISCLTFCAKA